MQVDWTRIRVSLTNFILKKEIVSLMRLTLNAVFTNKLSLVAKSPSRWASMFPRRKGRLASVQSVQYNCVLHTGWKHPTSRQPLTSSSSGFAFMEEERKFKAIGGVRWRWRCPLLTPANAIDSSTSFDTQGPNARPRYVNTARKNRKQQLATKVIGSWVWRRQGWPTLHLPLRHGGWRLGVHVLLI